MPFPDIVDVETGKVDRACGLVVGDRVAHFGETVEYHEYCL